MAIEKTRWNLRSVTPHFRTGVAASFLILGLMMSVWTSRTVAAQSTHMPDFEMADQFGEEVSHPDLDGKWTVMMVADRQGSTFSSELGAYLESGLSPLYPDMVFMAVANLEGAPRLIRSLIRKDIRRSNKTPVLLDWRGIFQASYPLSEQSVDVFLFNPSGNLTHHSTHHSFDSSATDQLGHRISGILSNSQ